MFQKPRRTRADLTAVFFDNKGVWEPKDTPGEELNLNWEVYECDVPERTQLLDKADTVFWLEIKHENKKHTYKMHNSLINALYKSILDTGVDETTDKTILETRDSIKLAFFDLDDNDLLKFYINEASSANLSNTNMFTGAGTL